MYLKYGELIDMLKKYREKFANIPETTAKFDALISEMVEWDEFYWQEAEYDARFEFADPKDDDFKDEEE